MANVVFDVQGTLLTDDEVPRPRAREAFVMLKEGGHDLYLWSSGGAGYAAGAADLLGVADLVSGCLDKRQEPDVPVDFAVDDDESVVEAHGGHHVKPFDGDPADKELLRAAQAVDGASGRGATPQSPTRNWFLLGLGRAILDSPYLFT